MRALEKPALVSGFLEDELRPLDMVGAIFCLNGLGTLMIEALKSELACKLYCFLARYFEHTPTVRDGAVTLAHRHSTSSRKQLRQVCHAFVALTLREVHPDGVHENEIKCLAARHDVRDRGQNVIEPFNLWRGVEFGCPVSERVRGFHGKNRVAQRRKPSRITPGPGPDV